MMSEDESSMQEPSIKLDSSDEKAPTGRVSVTRIEHNRIVFVEKLT